MRPERPIIRKVQWPAEPLPDGMGDLDVSEECCNASSTPQGFIAERATGKDDDVTAVNRSVAGVRVSPWFVREILGPQQLLVVTSIRHGIVVLAGDDERKVMPRAIVGEVAHDPVTTRVDLREGYLGGAPMNADALSGGDGRAAGGYVHDRAR